MVTKFEKPVGTEIGNLASLATSDKTSVVGAINSLNSKIKQKTLGSYSSLSAIESALTTQLGLMATGEIQEIFFTTTASGISVFNVWSGYVGTIYKTDTNRGVVSVIPHGTEPKTINGFYVNSAWTWESLYDKLTNSLAGQIRHIEFGSMCHVAGPFTGDGTTEINLGIGNYEGIVMGRNRSTGEMSIYYVGSGKINGWDGHNARVFTNGAIYQISGIVWQ